MGQGLAQARGKKEEMNNLMLRRSCSPGRSITGSCDTKVLPIGTKTKIQWEETSAQR